MSERLWVAELIISEATRVKLSSLHHLDADDVRQELVAVQGLKYRWRNDAPRGERVYVEIFVGRDRVLTVLYPVNHPLGDVYALGSAYPEPRGLDAVDREQQEPDSADGEPQAPVSTE